MILVRVTDTDGRVQPLAELNVRGDMNHAGMVPVITTYESPETDSLGSYPVQFTWTMGGEWIVTVNARLENGTTVSDQVSIDVRSEQGEQSEDHDDHG